MSGPARVSWDEARRRAHRAAARPLGIERLPLAEADGRTLAEPLSAALDLPHYASSAMDGWAVAGDPPWRLVRRGPLEAGEAAPIVTGGPVPDGCRAVLRQERGDVADGVLAPGPHARPDEPRDGEHVRPRAEEASAHDVLLPAGARLHPAALALAAVAGHDALPLAQVPRVRLVLTGDEVDTAGIPAPGRVRDAFGPSLPALVRLLGGEPCALRRLGDDAAALLAALAPGGEDVIVTTGGTGASSADLLHPVLARLGARMLVDGVACRPGGPALIAELPDGRLLAGLPGNPLAALVAALGLIRPLLAGMLGAPEPGLGRAIAGARISGREGTTRLLPYRLLDGRALPSERRGSGMLRGIAAADGILVCGPEGLRPGEAARTLPLPWAGG